MGISYKDFLVEELIHAMLKRYNDRHAEAGGKMSIGTVAEITKAVEAIRLSRLRIDLLPNL